MRSKQTVASIRTLKNFNRLSHDDVVARAIAVILGMTGNAVYPHPPVDIVALAFLVKAYSAAIAMALDGGKKAKATRDELRESVIKDLRLLAVYVENSCNNDPSNLSSSGFAAASTVRTPAGPAAIPILRKLNFGVTSGEFVVYIGTANGARSYNLRYAEMTGTTPGTWIVVPVVTVRWPTTVANLTPGKTYSFQVQALGSEGFSDWSDPVTSMCI